MLATLGGVWLITGQNPLAPASATGDPVPGWPVDETPDAGGGVREIAVAPAPGSRAPELTLDSLDGETLSLADLKGQVVLINFWATWCPPCRDEMPAIQKVYDQYAGHGFAVLEVNFMESDAQVRAFVEELGLTFPIVMDRNGDVTARYGVRGLPTSFFVDRSGVIQYVTVGGPMSDTFIESQLLLLSGDQGEGPDGVD